VEISQTFLVPFFLLPSKTNKFLKLWKLGIQCKITGYRVLVRHRYDSVPYGTRYIFHNWWKGVGPLSGFFFSFNQTDGKVLESWEYRVWPSGTSFYNGFFSLIQTDGKVLESWEYSVWPSGTSFYNGFFSLIQTDGKVLESWEYSVWPSGTSFYNGFFLSFKLMERCWRAGNTVHDHQGHLSGFFFSSLIQTDGISELMERCWRAASLSANF
jgi:hypothetical protein